MSWEIDWLLNVAEAALGERGNTGGKLAIIEFGAGTPGDPTQCEPGGRCYCVGVGSRQRRLMARWARLAESQRSAHLAYYGRFQPTAEVVAQGSRRRRPILDVLAPIVRRLAEDAGQVEIEDLSGAKARDQAAWIARDEEEARKLRRDTSRSKDDRERAADADASARAMARRLAGAMIWLAVTEAAEARIGRVTDELVKADAQLRRARADAAEIPQPLADLLEDRRSLVARLHGAARSRETAALARLDTRLAEVERLIRALVPAGGLEALRAVSVALARVAELEAKWWRPSHVDRLARTNGRTAAAVLPEDWVGLVAAVERHGQDKASQELISRLKRRAEGVVREAHGAWQQTLCGRCRALSDTVVDGEGLCGECAALEVVSS